MKKRKERVFPLILREDDGLKAAVDERQIYFLAEGVTDGLSVAVDKGVHWMDVHEVYQCKQEVSEVLPGVLLQQILEEDAEALGEDPALDEPRLGVRLLLEGLDHASYLFRPAKHEIGSEREIEGCGVLLKGLEPYFLFDVFFLGEMLDDLIIHAAQPILLED